MALNPPKIDGEKSKKDEKKQKSAGKGKDKK